MAKIQTERSLGKGVRPKVRGKYVHMLPKDHETWTMFLEEGPIKFTEVWYDIHVGMPVDVPKGSPEYMMKVALGVTRKRIDVIGRNESGLSIIEVKPHANMESVGQIDTYTDLFNREFKVNEKVTATIVSKTCDADILETAEKRSVMIIAMEGVLL